MSASTTPLGSRRLYLAVDCGGSKAAAAIAISSSKRGQPPTFLSRGFGGAANYTDVGLERFLNSVRQAVEAALDASRIEWREVGATCEGTSSPSPSRFAFPAIFHAAWLGIAGVDSPLNISVLSPHLSRLLNIPYPSPRLIVANDTSLLASPVIEKDDGLPADAVREGVVCIAGTGSIVMSFRSGRVSDATEATAQQTSTTIDSGSRKGSSPSRHARSNSSGRLLEAVGRVGGFGWLLGDEGGGYMVGKRAVRAVLDQADRERLGQWVDDARGVAGQGTLTPPSQDTAASSGGTLPSLLHAQGQPVDRDHLLRDRILAHWHLRSTDDLLDTVYSNEVILQPSKPDLYGAHRASTSSAGSSLLGYGGPAEGGGSGSGRSSIDEGSDATHDAVGTEDKTPSASLYIDPSQSLLPPGARQCEGESVDRNATPSPIPALHSYPPSPRKQFSVDASGDPVSGDSPLTIEAAELTRALSVSAAEQAGRGRAASEPKAEVPTLPTIAPPAPTLTSAGTTTTSPATTTQEQEQQSALGVRKLRLASLAPLVFHLAFTHNDEISLGILRGEIRLIVDQISLLLQREQHGSASPATPDARRVLPSRCTLCLGGSLLGVEGYRDILVEELRARGWQFKRVVHVEDVARRGCEALAKGWEDNEQKE